MAVTINPGAGPVEGGDQATAIRLRPLRRRLMERFPVEVARNRTTSGFEWFLVVDGERVQTSPHRVGVFTSVGHERPRPSEMLIVLLRRATKEGAV